MTQNPFFEVWSTPFGVPPFDSIRPEHFPPAFDQAMKQQLAEISVITGSAEQPSFGDTIEALERSGRLLDRVRRVFFNLQASNSNDARSDRPGPRAVRAHRRPLCATGRSRPGCRPAATARAPPPASCAQRGIAERRPKGADDDNFGAPRNPAHALCAK